MALVRTASSGRNTYYARARAWASGPALLMGALAAALGTLAPPTPVLAAPPAGTVISNTADGLATGLGPIRSNTVNAIVQPYLVVPPSLAFYSAPDFATTLRVSPLGQPLYVQATAPGCDLDPTLPDTIAIDFASTLTGDRDRLRAIETAPASGVFRIDAVATSFSALGTASNGNGILELRRGDLVTATLAGCGATTTTALLWIEPFGEVFDAHSGATVAGVRVALVDVTGEGNGGLAGGPARVWEDDGLTPAPSEQVSDAQGRFRFPRVASSTYRLAVDVTAPWAFPARVPPGSLPGGFLVDPAGSYGAPFRIEQPDSPVAIDLPLDSQSQVTLFTEIAASRPVVELTEPLEYTMRVANRSDSLLTGVRLHQSLPPGFTYVRGSARRDGALLADPKGGAGPQLDFAIASLAPRAVTTVSCQVWVGAGAVFGDALSQAKSYAGPWESNLAGVRVRVDAGIFSEEATVVGRVSLTLGNPDAIGTGIAGVRLWLDDGTFAITDAAGRYSFTGISPRTHAIKVDAATLPAGARLVAMDQRDAGQPGLRFLDLTRGEMQRAEFSVVGDTATVRETGERMLAAGGRLDDLGRSVARGTSPLISPEVAGDARALPANGISTGESTLPLARPNLPFLPVAAPEHAAPSVTLDQLIRTLDPDLGFVGLADLDTVTSAQIAVRVKGAIGTSLGLRVNGVRVPDSRVGLRVTVPGSGVEAWEYLGVALKPGINVLEVAPPHSAARVAVRVVAPGPVARLEVRAPLRVPADGRSLARLLLRTRDAGGIPTGARTLVTVTTTAGTLRADDLDPATPGLQVAIEDGETGVLLVAPTVPAEARVTVTSGSIEGGTTLRFVPDLRPLLAVGTFEGRIGFGRGGTFHRGAEGDGSSFEAEMDQFASVRRDGQAMAAAHGAVFMKGRVKEGTLLTLGYDSDRTKDDRMFRDLQSNSAFPLYGDGATRGYEAQSTGRLYARLDRGPSSVLYGDFVTRGSGSVRSLAAYNRSLTGAQTHWELPRAEVDAFTSRDRTHRQVVELRGFGLSGPYLVPGVPLLENSELVEIVVRDRNQPSMVLSVTTRQRFTDYELEWSTGRLMFRAPVPSLDPDLNPVFVRVTCETQAGGEPFWVSGAEGRVRVGPGVEMGGTYVDDHDPQAPRELRGGSLTAMLGGRGRLEAEVAATRAPGGDPGWGSRLELSRERGTTQVRVWGAATGVNFDNPGAGFAPGRNEGGARFGASMGGGSRLRGEALWSADAFGRQRQASGVLGVDRALGSALRGELGARVGGQHLRGRPDEPWTITARGRLGFQPPSAPAWSGYAEAEQDVRSADRRLLAVGGEYRVRARGRLYARQELISSLTGPMTLSDAQKKMTTLAGVDVDVTTVTHLYSEYRLGDAISGRESQAAVGLRNGWRLDNGVRVGTTFERVSPLNGNGAGPTTSASASLDFADSPDWKGSSRFEVRSNRAADSYLQTVAAAVRLDSSWTGLFRQHFDLTDASGAQGAARARLQIGAAWRPGGAWDALGRWEFHYDRDGVTPVPLYGVDGTSTGATGLGGISGSTLATPASRRRLAQILGIDATGRLDRHFVASVAWAGKRVRDEGLLGVTKGSAQWVRGRASLDLAHGWDVGLQSSTRIGDRLSQHRFGIGAELGRVIAPGLWLSAGWNQFGYRDDELTGADWTRAGAYLRLRAKFDEQLFGIEAPRPTLHEPEAVR